MKNLLSSAACAAFITATMGSASAYAQNTFNGYKGYYSNAGTASAVNTKATTDRDNPARNSNYGGPGYAVTGYQYIEGPSYRSPYADNNAGEWSYGKDADSPCYHGNYGYNGQTTNYDHSDCVVVYDAQTYVRLLRGSSSMGGTQFFGASGYGTQQSGSRYPSATHYANQSYTNGNTTQRLQPSPRQSGNGRRSAMGTYSAQAGTVQNQQHQRSLALGNAAPAGHSRNNGGDSGHDGSSDP